MKLHSRDFSLALVLVTREKGSLDRHRVRSSSSKYGSNERNPQRMGIRLSGSQRMAPLLFIGDLRARKHCTHQESFRQGSDVEADCADRNERDDEERLPQAACARHRSISQDEKLTSQNCKRLTIRSNAARNRMKTRPAFWVCKVDLTCFVRLYNMNVK